MTQAKEYHDSYTEFSKTLRAWMVAYGAGGPILVVSQSHLWSKLEDAPNAKILAILFFLGVLLQVLSALIYKWAMWERYLVVGNEKVDSWTNCVASYLSKQYWIDVVVDIGSFIFFGFATIGVLNVLL